MAGFVDTPIGPVPRVAARLSLRDRLGTIGARIGISRSAYTVAPGLYALGRPGPQSQVLVSANYKLSFDSLRCQLAGIDAWLLILDTRGINVWCAAGKGTFSTEEVIEGVRRSRLAEVVSHRELILPQLAAPGVAARKVAAGCAFRVVFGPIRAADLPAYLTHGQCDPAMREVTFTLGERAVLIPVELYLLARPLAVTLVLVLLLSGIGPEIFSPATALERGLALLAATGLGILGGAVLTPLCLPWLPSRQFWVKGLFAALPALACAWLLLAPDRSGTERAALMLWVGTVSSYLAMNFTGATPFTSPSGVEYEMRRGLAVQLGAALLGLGLWLAGPFI